MLKNNLKLQREKKGLTQLQVAIKVGLSERGYQRYESGERLPNVIVAQLIAVTLDTTVEKLFPVTDATEDGEVM